MGSLSGSDKLELSTQRTANPSKSVGGKKYVDKQIFTYTELSDATCQIDGCSESQGFSVKDFSTNYCDMRNLYCGSADGCKPVVHDFHTTQRHVSPSLGAGTDFSACIVPKDDAVL